MLTNILAVLVVVVTTNTYAPKQYWHPYYYLTYPAQEGGEWKEGSVNPWNFQGWGIDNKPKERDNPDTRITEIREIKTLSFDFEGKAWSAEIYNVVLSSVRANRTEQSVTTQTNGMTITTTVERWVEQ